MRDLARGRGARCLSVRGSELERQSPFNSVRTLLEPPVARASPRERERLLAGAAGAARRLLDPEGTRPGTPDEAFNLLHGLTWLAINLAEADPLLLLVDDAQWVDSPSARFFVYLADRLEDARIVLVRGVAAGRAGAPPGRCRGSVCSRASRFCDPPP